MNRLSQDSLNIIWSFINPKFKYSLNKTLFDKYYDVKIGKKNMKYIRNIIRNDLHYIFNYNCKLNWNYWLKIKKIRYKEYKFANYNQYILYLIQKYDSNRCKNIYLNLGDESVCKKKVKKRNRFWSN